MSYLAPLAAAFVLALSLAGPVKADEIRIGVLANRGVERCLAEWSPTAEYLTQAVPGQTFRIFPLNFDELRPAVQKGEVEFVLANSSIYVELESSYGAMRIATLRTIRPSGASVVFGGVIFCRAERTDLLTLRDLRGKSFLAADEQSFGGWRMAWRELLQAGVDPWRDFKNLRFAGNHDLVPPAIRDGQADAGTVRTEVLEALELAGKIRLSEFFILNRQTGDGFPFVHSTRLYPEWPIAKLRHTSEGLAQKVAIALLSLRPESPAALASSSAGWTIPQNYESVHDCLRELKIGPYAGAGQITLSDILARYWSALSLALLLFLVMALGSGVVLGLNRRLQSSHHKLQAEVEERKRAEAELSQAHHRLLTVLDSLEAEVSVIDLATYEILFANQQFKESYGLDPVGQACWLILGTPKISPCPNCVNLKLVGPDGQPTGLLVWERHDPATGRWRRNYDQAITWPDGRLVRLRAAFNITDLKQTQEEQVLRERLTGALETARAACHELNQPLQALIGHLDLLNLGFPPGPEAVRIERVFLELERMAEIIRRLSQLTRYQTKSYAGGGNILDLAQSSSDSPT